MEEFWLDKKVVEFVKNVEGGCWLELGMEVQNGGT